MLKIYLDKDVAANRNAHQLQASGPRPHKPVLLTRLDELADHCSR